MARDSREAPGRGEPRSLREDEPVHPSELAAGTNRRARVTDRVRRGLRRINRGRLSSR